MAFKHSNSKRDEKEKSLLQVDETFLTKILARNSSVGESQYDSMPGQIPFHWEIEPGKPKPIEEIMQPAATDYLKEPPNDENENEIIPPPSPPPAALSLALPRPLVTKRRQPTKSKVWLWNQIKKILQINKPKAKKSQGTNVDAKSINSDLEDSMPSSCNNSTDSSTFSSSSSSSSSKGPPSRPSKLKGLARGIIRWPF